MKRGEFTTLLVGAAAAWPLAARAQQPARKRRIGVLMALSESDPEAKPRVKAFEQGLQDWGWVKKIFSLSIDGLVPTSRRLNHMQPS